MRTRIESIRGIVKEGNSCLFLFFVIFNFLIFLSSLGILGCGVYLTVITKEANAFNISFLVTGGLMFIFSALAFKMRRSVHLLGLYLIILFFVFLFQLIITIIMIVKKQALIDLAVKYMSDSQKSIDEIKKFEDELGEHVLSVSYALIAFTAVIVINYSFYHSKSSLIYFFIGIDHILRILLQSFN